MSQETPSCDRCTGCTGRHTEEKAEEEIKAGPYLLFAAVMVVIVSLLVKWLF
ncbi:MAG: hypothetical protein HY912_19580 [Desulfomonile tiedjei]|uniref:Uncharacterized protein n=1 Tax=Desulfomonile tiedjei TaxID=2358 RepID=A0A9D6Z581_9BACT|nr:hypothetical protein [Desulfomonile tiedjei]